MSNSSDPDKAEQFVELDRGPNWLQTLSADDTGRYEGHLFFSMRFFFYAKNLARLDLITCFCC